jgi:alkanesulfonate monooxygenase SsuD/methylene tetrahydromethanopterin reductase-like flavin-dependent oxidoreductase (luciferase family)
MLCDVELGIYTFAEMTPDPATGRLVSPQQRLRDLIEEIELADQVGLDVFGVGEHHRPDFAVSAPAVVLAAAAERTRDIRLTSAVTVLSSDDPVRVFESFSTLDLLSGGRAEIMAGRGSFIESFPLFGYDLDDYDELFASKLGLLIELLDKERVTWSGPHRSPLHDVTVYPRPLQERIPILVGGSGERRTLRLAAAYADACNIIGEVDVVHRKVAALHAHCDAAGRDRDAVEVTQLSTTLVGRDGAEVQELVERLRPRKRHAERYAAAVNAGTVADQIGRFRALADAGVGTAIVSLPDLGDTAPLERFAPVITAFT